MGICDEHWCSLCKKDLDKKEDTYVEINTINPDKKKAKKEGLHTRSFLCAECMKKQKQMKKVVNIVRKHANPNFKCTIRCESTELCPDFEPRNKNVNCKHIYVIGDKVYCGRRHPGSRKLNQDRVMVDQETHGKIGKFFKSIFTADAKKGVGECVGLALDALGMSRGALDNIFMYPDREIVVNKNLVLPTHTCGAGLTSGDIDLKGASLTSSSARYAVDDCRGGTNEQ